MKALLHHEGGHKNLGVRAANEIEREIGNMAARSTCKQLEIAQSFIQFHKGFSRSILNKSM